MENASISTVLGGEKYCEVALLSENAGKQLIWHSNMASFAPTPLLFKIADPFVSNSRISRYKYSGI